MIEAEQDVRTRDGEMNTVVFQPDGAGPFPAIIVFMPASGIREELRGLARRLAGGGYLVLLPNMYYRLVRQVDIDANRLKDPAYEPVTSFMVKLNQALTNERSAIDTAGLLAFIDRHPAAKKDRVGVLGYCMGGRLALTAIGAFPERIKAAVSLYGAGLITDAPDSPHLRADRIDGELYLGFAEHDEYVPREQVERLGAHLRRAGVKHEIEVFPDTEHGFVFPLRYCYQESGAERSWQRVFEFFGRVLRDG
jgi:carboxymethylenebutenolidase